MQKLYEAFVGDKNRVYYLAKFKQFDQHPGRLKASWNWPAFFCGAVWAIYRKMYVWFFAFWGIVTLTSIIDQAGSPGFGSLIFLVFWIGFAIYANSLYHNSVKKKIAEAQSVIQEEAKLLDHLSRKGGVHRWVIWVFVLLPLGTILLAILIPKFA